MPNLLSSSSSKELQESLTNMRLPWTIIIEVREDDKDRINGKCGECCRGGGLEETMIIILVLLMSLEYKQQIK